MEEPLAGERERRRDEDGLGEGERSFMEEELRLGEGDRRRGGLRLRD